MADVDHIENLWKSINRVDSYITSSSFRTALLLTFNVAIFGASYKAGFFETITDCSLFLVILMAYVLSSAASVICALYAVKPNVGSSRQSVFYFIGLANDLCAERERERFINIDQNKLLDDLYWQYVDISKVAVKKFTWQRRAVSMLILNFFLFSCLLIIEKMF